VCEGGASGKGEEKLGCDYNQKKKKKMRNGKRTTYNRCRIYAASEKNTVKKKKNITVIGEVGRSGSNAKELKINAGP